ncbi:conserved membrane hypothetical protein [Crenothrix polyspora]|uniref:Transmembrane protein n=1 Tax=Crenothrix polyspora TaxID=360316 RepID=A0A1R4GZM2_9GAMM|nr:hypothetical protein [Crenothrix polyspora]SJM89405.1 conserved membrane hypothetical protein [Crenothrix polyspora]
MRFRLWLWLGVFIFAACVQATPLKPEQVPEPLKPWVNWVLKDTPDLGCPFMYNSYEQKRCSWPTQLHLDFAADKGTFAINWKVYQESWVSLPGDQKRWPLNVTVNARTAPVMERNGVPSIKLPAGSYDIKGDFLWKTIPENLSIPSDTGLINVRINGQPLPAPVIKEGQLWLTENDIGQKKSENTQNNLDVQVFRYFSDDVPMRVVTRLVLNVSGEQREIRLPKPVLDDFIPLSLQSPLPARIEPDGQLLLQVRPGQWQIDINARSRNVIKIIPFNTVNAEWPESELWVFEARPDLRVVEIEKLATVDASQTNLPDEWKHLPTYKITQGQMMGFKVIRSGDPEPEPNQLNLNRKLWLNFDGEGYTVNDVITGTMTRDWRLNALQKTQLGKVMLDGNNQLITLQADSGKQGVEVRKGVINLDADSRVLGSVSDISAVGWEQSFRNVSAELNLPPGWRLLAAAGVDNVPDSWLSRWNLLDFFLVLIAALAVAKLFTLGWGVFALVTLALIWHEPEAPRYVWLFILGATALIKVLPASKFLTFMESCQRVFGVALILIAIPFMIAQVRTGLYPQLEYPLQGINYVQSPVAQSASAPVMAEYKQSQSGQPAVADMSVAPEAESTRKMKAMCGNSQAVCNAIASKVEPCKTESSAELQEDCRSRTLDKMFETTMRMGNKSEGEKIIEAAAMTDFERIDPKAKVQTGPGLPQWQWHKVMLSWNGSVNAEQQLHLWYLSPMMSMVVNFLRVALVLTLALVLFGVLDKFKFNFKALLPVLLWCSVLPMAAMPTQKAHADFPEQAVLDELKTRLLEAPDCVPACAQIPYMKVVISDKDLTITLNIHAQQSVAIPLPVDYEQWFPNQVTVNGAAAQGLYRDNNGLWINLPEGGHQVVLRGVPPLLGSFTLPFILKANQVSVEHSDWEVSGLQENGQVENQLQFTRVAKVIETTGTATAQLSNINLPPFVRIERQLQLGLDWRVVTQMVRVSPADAGIILSVPLLVGESVTTPGIVVKNGFVEVNMAAQQTEMQWESTLEKSDALSLVAPQTEQWVEVWQANISPIWHVETSGIAMMHLQSENQWLPEWHPWPGEKLSLQITRPQSVEGQTLTIDNSDVQITPGIRSQDTTLKFTLRSSQGTQHTLMLPEKAVLQSVMINGQTLPIRQENRKLTLPINPGKQDVQINWQEAIAMQTVMTTPQIDLGRDSVNSNLHVTLGENRWLLFAFGPKLGPAVLFWGVLIVLSILSFGLGKIQMTPLKSRHWFLLLIGLSQIPLELAGIVIIWLMLLGWRFRQPVGQLRYFNALQSLIAVLTLVSLGVMLFAVGQGLLGASPDMQITGNQSSAYLLNWYQDRSLSTLPTATLISVPLIVYRLLMFVWSFWLAMALLSWLQWGWQCFSHEGLWHKKIAKEKPLVFDDKSK